MPRHKQIVEEILGTTYSQIYIILIGIGEVCIAIWIISNLWKKLCGACQIILIALMNIIEFITVPKLLLFGKLNIVIAFIFITVVYVHYFIVKTKANELS